MGRTMGMKLRKRANLLPKGSMVLAVAALCLVLTGCPERDGPAERAGEAVDDAAESVGDALTPDGPAENAGEKLDETFGGD